MFGLGKGKMSITIQKTNYAPGDTISGNVALTLKKPAKARGLSLCLIGKYKATQSELEMETETLRDDVESKTEELPYPLEPKFERTAVIQNRPFFARGRPSTLGMLPGEEDIRKTVRICGFEQQLDGEKEYVGGRQYHFDIKIRDDTPTDPVKWYLLAKLDIPGGLDISKKVDVTIG
jgi:Arrestin (or S-antigen), N-terminal domain